MVFSQVYQSCEKVVNPRKRPRVVSAVSEAVMPSDGTLSVYVSTRWLSGSCAFSAMEAIDPLEEVRETVRERR
jgi:hypothetical protein